MEGFNEILIQFYSIPSLDLIDEDEILARCITNYIFDKKGKNFDYNEFIDEYLLTENNDIINRFIDIMIKDIDYGVLIDRSLEFMLDDDEDDDEF